MPFPLDTWLHRIGWTGFITGCGFLIRLALKGGQLFSKAETVVFTIEDTHALLKTATTNHLSHIETGITQLGETMRDGFDRMEKAIDRSAQAIERASNRSSDDAREIRQAIKES